MNAQLSKNTNTHSFAVATSLLASIFFLSRAPSAQAGWFGGLGNYFKRYSGSGTGEGVTRTTMGALRGAHPDPRQDPKRVADQARIDQEAASARLTAGLRQAAPPAAAPAGARPPSGEAAQAAALGAVRRAHVHDARAAQAAGSAQELMRAHQAQGHTRAQMLADPQLKRALVAKIDETHRAGQQRGIAKNALRVKHALKRK